MKLKLVVASMSLMGLVSCPAFAATASDTSTKHAHTKKVVHHVKKTSGQTRHETREERIDEENMEVAPGPVDYKGEAPPECIVDPATLILDESSQNLGRSLPSPCNPGWFHRVAVSGGFNFDLGKWGDRNADYQGENYERFSLNDAYLNVSAIINEWTRAFLSIDYSNTTPTGGFDSDHYGYSSVYQNRRLSLEQAYATLGNFDVSPFYLQVGKQFQDFSRYEIHAITRSMTQVLSEVLATSVKAGFIVPMGFNGSVYAFDDPVPKFDHTRRKTNYGVALGYDQPSEQLGWDVGIGWLYNMIGAQDIAHGVSNFTGFGYHRHVEALALYGDVNSGPFTLAIRWTGALERFNKDDLPANGFADTFEDPFFDTVVFDDAHGAKPWAVGVLAGYNFDAFGCRSNGIYVGYQHSHEAAGLGLPRGRWVAGYDIEVWRNAVFGIEYNHDQAYGVSHGGLGENTNLWTIRTAFKFG